MKNKQLINNTVAALLVLGLATVSVPATAASGDMEKCYGVVKKGLNDCGTETHACAGQASKGGGSKEWIYLPAGSCEKIVGGSVESK